MKTPYPAASLAALLFSLAGSGDAPAATPVITNPDATSFGVVFGGDPDEGLDLEGTFAYALAIGADPALSVTIRDATFLGLISDQVNGATLVAGNTAAGWYPVEYGDTPEDDNLELATRNIRWSDANAEIKTVQLTLDRLQVGASYKLQLLFGEACCNRGFDVLIDGQLIVKDFNPGEQQGGINIGNQIALITHTLTASTASIQIVLDGTQASPDYTDHNAILNAITLEQVGSAGDSDGDGLSDAWEQLYFENLAQTAGADPDNDGLTNAEELAAGSNPTLPDTDGDGLLDGAEVKTHDTDPNKADTDGDLLSDAEEVNTHKTNPRSADTDGDLLSDHAELIVHNTDPIKADTDGDGANDYAEVRLLTDPRDPAKKPTKTTAHVFTGPDPGQGLDLQGTFVQAISFGNEPEGGQIHDAFFTPDTAAAFLVESSSVANGWNVDVSFGDTAEQMVLSSVMSNIRWSAANSAIPTVTATFSELQVGASYKLQLLFGERLWARGFDININQRPAARDFAPFQWQGGFTGPGGATPRTNGVVLTHTFVAHATDAVFVLDGRSVTDPSIVDRNPIINGATLERVANPLDSDNDGLWDPWEIEVFGDLSQTANGDPDNDGLNNAGEFAANTDPNVADTDGDGLSDGAEVNVHRTSPTSTDTDRDGLSDGAEINTHGTDPTKADSDEDGLPDGLEILSSGPASKLSNILTQAFYGGDPEDGLDLQGNFRYAFNVSSAGPAGKAGDADFTADNAPGIQVVALNNIPAWSAPEYGDSAADDVVEKLTQSIRYDGTIRVTLSNLTPASTYRLQLLFYEQCCMNRGFNIYVDGELAALDFSPPNLQGGANPGNVGAMASVDIDTQRDNMVIILTVNGRTDPALTDPNAILNAVTLETLKEGPVQTRPTLNVSRAANGQITISTDGTLQSADAVNGTYTNLPEKTVTLDPATGGSQRFYRATR
jgi:hypothetical protein